MFLPKNNLFIKAKESKYLANIILGPILALLMIIFGQILGGFLIPIIYNPFDKLASFLNLSPNFTNLFLEHILLTLPTILMVFLWVKLIEKRKFSSIGFTSNNFIIKYLKGFFIGLLMMTSTVALLYLFGSVTVDNTPKQSIGTLALSNVLLIIPAWMIQSANEEIVVRGWLMNVLGARYTPVVGLIVSSVFFGVVHLANPGITFIAVLNIILVGLFLGMYVIKTNDLWGVCGIHAAWNFSQGNVFGFEVSGGKALIGSIFDLKLKGSDFISGGIFGPEAGICATIVLTVCAIIIAINLKNKKILND